MYGDRPIVSRVGPYAGGARPMEYASGYNPPGRRSPHGSAGPQMARVINPSMNPHRTASYYLRVRARVLCGVVALLGLLTFVSFWALYYWPIAVAFLMMYLSIVCYRETAGFGAVRQQWGFSGGLFVGRELVFVLVGVTMLLCFAQAVVGVILCIVETDATRVAFQAFGAATGVVSLVALFLLHTTLKHLEGPIITMQPSPGPPPTVSSGGYYANPYGEPVQAQHYPYSVPVQAQPVMDSFQRNRSPLRRPPSPRRVSFEEQQSHYPDIMSQRYVRSPTSVIPPAGLAEMGVAAHAPFGSPSPRYPAPYPHPTQQMSISPGSPTGSLYPERQY